MKKNFNNFIERGIQYEKEKNETSFSETSEMLQYDLTCF